ncbi:MAG: carboxypeptidase-like regulatory domain-containing protein [Gemmatimonadota bacterium]|jgi:hypothetical protein|nr:carboxypeptidase-like regulatory domain-containing protein [Gemmatimonadota bacterium]
MTRRQNAILPAILGFALLFAGCRGEEELILYDYSSDAIVVGVITDSDGAPVEGAVVTVVTYIRGVCEASEQEQGPPLVVTSYPVRTGANGSFLKVLSFLGLPAFVGCLEFTVVPPEKSGLATRTASGFILPFTRDEEVSDTLYVSIELPESSD